MAADRQKLFNGKELVTSTKSAYQISWPILLWGALVLILYSVSYTALSAEHDTVVYIKMTQKARIAAGRLTYYAMRASLEPVSAGCGVFVFFNSTLSSPFTAGYGLATLSHAANTPVNTYIDIC